MREIKRLLKENGLVGLVWFGWVCLFSFGLVWSGLVRLGEADVGSESCGLFWLAGWFG